MELIPEAESRSTAQNAANVARKARELGVRDLVVVTSSWHRLRVGVLMRAALRGSGIRLHIEGADALGRSRSWRERLRRAAAVPAPRASR